MQRGMSELAENEQKGRGIPNDTETFSITKHTVFRFTGSAIETRCSCCLFAAYTALPEGMQAPESCAHTIETVCGGVRLCCARGRSDAVRKRASSSLSRDCRGGVFFAAVQTRVQSQQFDHDASSKRCHSGIVTLTQTQCGIGGIAISITRQHQSHVDVLHYVSP